MLTYKSLVEKAYNLLNFFIEVKYLHKGKEEKLFSFWEISIFWELLLKK